MHLRRILPLWAGFLAFREQASFTQMRLKCVEMLRFDQELSPFRMLYRFCGAQDDSLGARTEKHCSAWKKLSQNWLFY